MKQSDALSIGAQQQFVGAAERAHALQAPINVLLTVRWRSLLSDNMPGEWRSLDGYMRARRLATCIRKWMARALLPIHYLWVRESTVNTGEHLHFAMHLPRHLQKPFVAYVAKLLQEPALPFKRTPSEGRSEGEFACGECSSWQLARDTRPDRAGRFLALYVGKGEPDERTFRGRVVANTRKASPHPKYRQHQGSIEGNHARYGRFDISKALKDAKS